MANKNDLRYIKTERLIEATYISLKKKSKTPIKVSDLCKEALINKSTFYAHYETMEVLHEHICAKEIDKILASCPHIDAAFTNTAAFVESLVKVIGDNLEITTALFRDDFTAQTNAYETRILKHYLHGDESPEKEMKITFGIGGAARLLIRNQNADRIQMTIKLIGRILDN